MPQPDWDISGKVDHIGISGWRDGVGKLRVQVTQDVKFHPRTLTPGKRANARPGFLGLNKLEDMDEILPGEIQHVHFQDVPDIPRELLDNSTRIIPGDGVSPLNEMLLKLAEKEYAGPLSVELFLPQYQEGDPYEVALEIRRKCEAVMEKAGVL